MRQTIDRLQRQSTILARLMESARELYLDICGATFEIDYTLLSYARRNDLASISQILFENDETALRFLEVRHRLVPHHVLSDRELLDLAEYLDVPVEDLPMLKQDSLHLFPDLREDTPPVGDGEDGSALVDTTMGEAGPAAESVEWNLGSPGGTASPPAADAPSPASIKTSFQQDELDADSGSEQTPFILPPRMLISQLLAVAPPPGPAPPVTLTEYFAITPVSPSRRRGVTPLGPGGTPNATRSPLKTFDRGSGRRAQSR